MTLNIDSRSSLDIPRAEAHLKFYWLAPPKQGILLYFRNVWKRLEKLLAVFAMKRYDNMQATYSTYRATTGAYLTPGHWHLTRASSATAHADLRARHEIKTANV